VTRHGQCRIAALFALALIAAGCSMADGGADTTSQRAANNLSWQMPADMPAGDTTQASFEEFAWRSFVALNWPVGTDGQPDSTVVIGAAGDAVTVWENYKEAGEIFLAGGAAPTPWGERGALPPECRAVGAGDLPVFAMMAKVSNLVAQFVEPFAGPVVDQDSAFARFAIHVNRPTFDYIVGDTLYRKDVQRRQTAPLRFPAGQAGTGNVGAVVVKSAWKVLAPRDSVQRFHALDAYVYTEPTTDPAVPASCRHEQLGLVGFHIAHKTAQYPQWIWATFEQVDNVTVPNGSTRRPSFSDPDCNCPDRENEMPPRPWHADRPAQPTQVVRVTPIDRATMDVNARWQAELAAVNAASPWQHYELVGVQRPRMPSDTTGLGAPYPQYLANTVLETYIQGTFGRSSSCMECHFRASIPGDSATGGAKFSDYSFLFMLAREPSRP
jgi:hypothetical protein